MDERSVLAAVFSLPLLYLAMAPMVSFARLPFPAALAPMRYPLRFALVQLLLVMPVIGIGYRFYTVGFKAIWQRSPNMDSLIAVGTSAAFLYSLYNVFQIATGHFGAVDALYFETGRRHHHADPAWQITGGCFQGANQRSH